MLFLTGKSKKIKYLKKKKITAVRLPEQAVIICCDSRFADAVTAADGSDT